MPQKIIDMVGMRFGKLVVTERSIENSKQGKPLWKCKCDCGNTVIVPRKRLIEGSTKSCGCYRREFSSYQHKTHGMSKNGNKHTRLYRIWVGIKDRCCNKNSKYWSKYGGKGITICKEWENDYMAFYNWSMNNGYAEDLTIDRIENASGYFPNNCRWVTYQVQENNRTNNVLFNINGEIVTLAQLARMENTTRALAERKHKADKILKKEAI